MKSLILICLVVLGCLAFGEAKPTSNKLKNDVLRELKQLLDKRTDVHQHKRDDDDDDDDGDDDDDEEKEEEGPEGPPTLQDFLDELDKLAEKLRPLLEQAPSVEGKKAIGDFVHFLRESIELDNHLHSIIGGLAQGEFAPVLELEDPAHTFIFHVGAVIDIMTELSVNESLPDADLHRLVLHEFAIHRQTMDILHEVEKELGMKWEEFVDHVLDDQASQQQQQQQQPQQQQPARRNIQDVDPFLEESFHLFDLLLNVTAAPDAFGPEELIDFMEKVLGFAARLRHVIGDIVSHVGPQDGCLYELGEESTLVDVFDCYRDELGKINHHVHAVLDGGEITPSDILGLLQNEQAVHILTVELLFVLRKDKSLTHEEFMEKLMSGNDKEEQAEALTDGQDAAENQGPGGPGGPGPGGSGGPVKKGLGSATLADLKRILQDILARK